MLNRWTCLHIYFKILFINSNIWDILSSVFINCWSLKFMISLLILTIKFLLYAGLQNDMLFGAWIIWTSFYEFWLLFWWAAKVLENPLDPVWLYLFSHCVSLCWFKSQSYIRFRNCALSLWHGFSGVSVKCLRLLQSPCIMIRPKLQDLLVTQPLPFSAQSSITCSVIYHRVLPSTYIAQPYKYGIYKYANIN